MGIEKIYLELSKREEDEYYIKLAENEVLFVPVVVDILLEKNNRLSGWAESLLEKISEKHPMIVYPYISYISRALDNSDDFGKWNVWKIISNIIACDYCDYWQNLKERYFCSLKSSQISEFSISCECALKIISAKPDDRAAIIDILSKVSEREFILAGKPSSECLSVAKQRADEVLERINSDIPEM